MFYIYLVNKYLIIILFCKDVYLVLLNVYSHYFGSSVDIHSGGIDLLFPHHENEEAQCCAYHNVDNWVKYWIHSGFY